MSSDLEVRKREISALVDGAGALERSLLEQGIAAVDEEDRMEAFDIIARIERRILANMTTQAAE